MTVVAVLISRVAPIGFPDLVECGDPSAHKEARELGAIFASVTGRAHASRGKGFMPQDNPVLPSADAGLPSSRPAHSEHQGRGVQPELVCAMV